MSRTFWDMYDEYEASLAVDELSEPILGGDKQFLEVPAEARELRMRRKAGAVIEVSDGYDDDYDEYRDQNVSRIEDSGLAAWNSCNRIERV